MKSLRGALKVAAAWASLSQTARLIDREQAALIEALTSDERYFPKAIKIGHVDTDVATITIHGGGGNALSIPTGSDVRFSVYGDNYQHGIPGRIIIELGCPVKVGDSE
jgi:hypothetical protein